MTTNVSVDGPHPVDLHVGRRVCELRMQRGFNQSDLGRALGLTFQQVQKYEKGSNRISSSKLWDIARFLTVDIAYFFEGLGDPTKGLDQDGPEHLVHAGPATRYSVELASLVPRLAAHQQKLALDLVRSLADLESV